MELRSATLGWPSRKELKKIKEREEYDRKHGSIWAKPAEKSWSFMKIDKPLGRL